MDRVVGAFEYPRRSRSRWAPRAAASWTGGAAAAALQLPRDALAAAPLSNPSTIPSGLATPLATLLAVALTVALMALVIGALLTLRGARARRRLAAELGAARTRSHCVESLLDHWLWHSDREHRIVSIRPPANAASSEWSAAQTAAFVWERFGVDDEAALRSRLDNAAPVDDIAARLDSGDGAPRHGLLRARMHTDEQGRFAGYHGLWRELPATAAVPAPIATAASSAVPSLHGSTVLAAATESEQESFGFTVSHDLRAPIRVVEGFTKIVKEDYGRLLDRVGIDHLDRVLGAAARMNNMIDALLEMSRLSSQPLARQSVDLSQLARYVCDDLKREWPQREVTVEIEPGMQVLGDPTLLRVMLENLLGNAWKYTAKSTPAQIAFVRDPGDPDAFTVRDNGAGFDMRFADRLFGVFQRLHSANDFPGTGVGLASVRRIVRRHGGHIRGEAEPGRGARFHFSLPPEHVSH